MTGKTNQKANPKTKTTMRDLRTDIFKNAKRIVVKAGSGVLTGANGLNLKTVRSISADICALMDASTEVLFVSSGAMAVGEKKLGVPRPTELPQRQAIAAIGQAGLIMEYEKIFAKKGKNVAQVLLTGDGLSSRKRYLNARNTLNQLLDWGIVPIINENDTVAVEEIKFGDNDNLAAQVALLMNADLLINLTDIDGLYDKDPRQHPDAQLIESVTTITKKMEAAASNIPGAVGTGGMLSKLKAAKKLMAAGIPMIIAKGSRKNVLRDLAAGKALGTFFAPQENKLSSKKCWIAFTQKAQGTLVVDKGAAEALAKRGKSLLPGGITKIKGEFGVGAPVEIKTSGGRHIGTGLVNYSAADIRAIKGLKTSQIKKVLGEKPYDEIIHRDNLAISC